MIRAPRGRPHRALRSTRRRGAGQQQRRHRQYRDVRGQAGRAAEPLREPRRGIHLVEDARRVRREHERADLAGPLGQERGPVLRVLAVSVGDPRSRHARTAAHPPAQRSDAALLARHVTYSAGAELCYGKRGDGSYTSERPSGGCTCSKSGERKCHGPHHRTDVANPLHIHVHVNGQTPVQ